jgi:hypothetical protein
MNYVNLEVGNKTYKLRISTRGIIQLEKQLGNNPLSIFGADYSSVPSITSMVAVLHAALQQFNHSNTLNDAYDIFDEYIAEGHATTDFIPVIIDIYRVSGIIPKEDEVKN